MSEFRTQAARRMAATSPETAAALRRAVAAITANPPTDEQVAVLRRCLPPVEHAKKPAA